MRGDRPTRRHRRQPVVINPGGGPLDIPDVDTYLAGFDACDEEPMVDLGGDMIVPLREVLDL